MGAAEIFGSGLCAAPVPQHSGASTFTTGYLYSRRSRQDPLTERLILEFRRFW